MAEPFQLLFDLNLTDLNPIMAGEAAAASDHYTAPFVCSCVVIYHIRRGYGVFHRDSREYRVGPGHAFIVLPGDIVSIHSDSAVPWEYAWIGFTGKLASRFSALPPVFILPKDAFPNLYDLCNAPDSIGYLLSGDLFTLYATLLDPQYQERDYIQLIVEHIEKNYMQKLTVENFALRFNMDRRYLTQQFKAAKGVSVRTYLTEVRLTKAAELLSHGCSTSQAAVSCGFGNTSNFQKMFTARYGMTPLQWKKKNAAKV